MVDQSNKPQGTFSKLMSSTLSHKKQDSEEQKTHKLQEEKFFSPDSSTAQLKKGELQNSRHDTMIPRQHDTVESSNHDTMIPQSESVIFELVRKAVKQIGKEAATHRFTLEEKHELADIEYTYKRQGVRTSENEITRIAINYFIEDYRQNGEESILAKILKRLNS